MTKKPIRAALVRARNSPSRCHAGTSIVIIGIRHRGGVGSAARVK
nr:hypothetical protein [Candidatus Sigynarchaeum springense]